MKAEYKRDLQNNYLILEIQEDAEEDNYRMRMIEQNEIPGLLRFRSSRKNGVLQLYYEVTSMQPLESIYEKKTMKYQDIVFILSGIRNTLEELQKYLLNPMQIVFDPRYVFTGPDRKRIELCYIPGTWNDAPITLLSEYILKKLDHEDGQAVALGYQFYQRTLEENFSLQKTLKDMLSSVREEDRQWNAPADKEGKSNQRRNEQERNDQRRNDQGRNSQGQNGQGRNEQERNDLRQNNQQQNVPEQGGQGDRDTYEVIHKERRSSPEKKWGKLFSAIHPAVLLSGLLLTAVVEITYYFGMINLTEAGGIFFLMLAVEMLINRYWHNSKERKRQEENRWVTNEEEELYKILQEEMYETPHDEPGIEETRCLVPSAAEERIRLVCIGPELSLKQYPDIVVGEEPVCVGKIKGESDVLLDSPTVSRNHARLILRDGICYVKDLNSKNGTFCNGERLRPQEERPLEQGDLVGFAEIEYRAVL